MIYRRSCIRMCIKIILCTKEYIIIRRTRDFSYINIHFTQIYAERLTKVVLGDIILT